MAYSFDDTGEGYSFTDNQSPVPTEQATAQRSIKASYALGDQAPAAGEIAQTIMSGNEKQFRDDVAQTEAVQNDAARTQVLMRAAARNQELTPDDIGTLQQMNALDLRPDPDTILEKKFAQKYTNDVLGSQPDNQSIFNRFGLYAPQEASRDTDVFTDLTERIESDKTRLENLHSEWKQTSWADAIPQYIGQVVPLWSAYKLHNALTSAPISTILPGDNLGEQISYANALEAPKRKAVLDKFFNDPNINQLDKMTFAQALVSFNATDSISANVMGVADATGLASTLGGPLIRVGGKLVRAAIPVINRAGEKVAADTAEAAVQEMAVQAGVKPAQPKTYYIPEAAAKKLDAVQIGEGPATSFKMGETEMAPKPSMVYVTPEEAEKLASRDGSRIVTFQDGRIARSVKGPDGQWSIPFESGKVSARDLPKEGLVPVDLGNSQNLMGSKVYSDVKVHSPITSVSKEDNVPTFYTDLQNGVTVAPGKSGAGMVPVEVHPDGTVNFRPTQTGDVYNIPISVARQLKPVQKFGRAPEYTASFDKNGQPVFWLDRKNKVFVNPVPEGPDTVAVSVGKDGRFQFLATGKTPAEVASNDFKTGLKDAAKAVSDTNVDPQAIMTGMGDIPKAAQVGAQKQLVNQVKGEPTGLQDILDTVQSSFNPSNFFGQGKALSREFTSKIVNSLNQDTQFLMNVLGKLHVPRGVEQAVQAGIVETTNKFKAQYGGRLSDAILDFVHVPPEINANKVNVDTLVMRVGKPNGTPFTSRAEAEHYLKDIYEANGQMSKDAGYVSTDIKQQGASFYINVEKHIDETSPAYIAQLRTTENTTPVNMWNMMLNRIRSSEDLLAKVQRDNRNIATHAPQILNKALREQIEKTRGALSSKQRKEVLEVLTANRDDTNLATGQRGQFYTSAADFEQAFLQKVGHLPTQEQTAHYFNYVRVSDFDWLIRNVASYRDKARLGVEQFSWKGFDEKAGTVRNTPWVEGKALDSIPWGGQDAGIWIQEAGGAGRLVYKHDLVNSAKGLTKLDIEKMYKEQGYKVFQVFDPPARPLRDTLGVDEQIHFVLTNGLEQKALGWNQIDYRPGGHSIYKYDFYVKQPQLQKGVGGRDYYYGDNSIMNFATQSQADKYAERMDTARVMLKNNDPNLDAYLAANLPYSRQDFEKKFFSGHLNMDHPIVSVKNGTTSFDRPDIKRAYASYVDATKSEYNLGAVIDKSFQAERDAVLDTVKEGGGVFQIAPAAQFDPYTALNRGLGQAVRNLWMADYKIGAVQHWIEEFGPVMDPAFKTVSNSPLYFLHNPQWNEKGDKAMLAAAKASRLAIVNFIGAQSEIGGKITHLQNALMNSVYNRVGQTAAETVADHALPMIKDPSTYLRAVGFHTKLGFFNPIQLFVQSQSLAHTIAVAGPKNGVPGMAGGLLTRFLIHNDNPAILDRMAGIAGKFGWKEEDFKQMVQAMKSSGMAEVGGETTMRDDVFDPKLYRSTLGHWLDKGTMFLNEGERLPRLSGFATAFREWKLANPTAELTNREMGRIMNRANLLSVDMTRAASASWQSGIFSVPLQFLAFNARLAEQFIGKRLTTAEKLRAFGTYSALYGVPTAAAGALGVWPFYDDIKTAAMNRGIDLSPAYVKGLMEGIPHLMISAATGHDYNIAQRLGPNGTNLFRDAFSGEKSVLQVLGGPSSSIVGDIWNSTDPLRRKIAGAFTGDSESFPLTAADLKGALSVISTFSLAARVQGALSYGKYISNKGLQVGDMDGMDAAMSVLGLTPSHIADANLLANSTHSDSQAQKPYEQLILQNHALAMKAGAEGNTDLFNDYMKRIAIYVKLGDFNTIEQQRIYNRANKTQVDSEDRIRAQWATGAQVPASQYIDRFNSFVVNSKGK